MLVVENCCAHPFWNFGVFNKRQKKIVPDPSHQKVLRTGRVLCHELFFEYVEIIPKLVERGGSVEDMGGQGDGGIDPKVNTLGVGG